MIFTIFKPSQRTYLNREKSHVTVCTALVLSSLFLRHVLLTSLI